jgi:hypothetical protein
VVSSCGLFTGSSSTSLPMRRVAIPSLLSQSRTIKVPSFGMAPLTGPQPTPNRVRVSQRKDFAVNTWVINNYQKGLLFILSPPVPHFAQCGFSVKPAFQSEDDGRAGGGPAYLFPIY